MTGPLGRAGRAAAKTALRTRAYFAAALLARPPARDQVLVAWGLVAAPFAAGLGWGDAAAPTALPLLAGLVVVLAGISAIDARWGLIPDPLSAAVFAGGLLQAILAGGMPALWPALAGSIGVYGAGWGLGRLHLAWRGFEGFGRGDVKLIAAAVPWLGIAGLSTMILIAVASALAGIAVMRLDGPVGRRDAIAFGPHLALGLAWAAVLGPVPG